MPARNCPLHPSFDPPFFYRDQERPRISLTSVSRSARSSRLSRTGSVDPVEQEPHGDQPVVWFARLAVPRANRLTSTECVTKIASTPEELQTAFRLTYDVYRRAGLTRPNPFQMRVLPCHLYASSDVVITKRDGRITHTMTLVVDGEDELPMERTFADEVAIRRCQGIRLAEVTCLASWPDGATHHVYCMRRLMRFVAQCARHRCADQLLIAVHPKHQGFYRRFAGFQPISDTRVYRSVGNKPAVAMALDFEQTAHDQPRIYKRFFQYLLPEESFEPYALPSDFRAELKRVVDANTTNGCDGDDMEIRRAA